MARRKEGETERGRQSAAGRRQEVGGRSGSPADRRVLTADRPLLAPFRRFFSQRSLRTVSVVLLLMGLYGLYRLTVTPLVEPPSISRHPFLPETVRRINGRSAIGRQMAERYLWYKRWPAEANSTLRTDEALVYFDEYRSAESDRAVRFEPFALIWFQKGRTDGEPPITIISDSAYLRFSEEINKFPDPDPGRIVAAALQGDVFIAGPDGLQVTGKNFEFEEGAKRIWCDNEIAFRYGPHRGKAHGLQIELILQEKAGSDQLSVSGLRSLRLRRDVEMNLVSGGEDLGPEQTPPRPNGKEAVQDSVRFGNSGPQGGSGQSPSSEGPRHVRIRSDGPFEFDVQSNRGVFEDRVRVHGLRPDEPDQADSLQCDRLLLVFEPSEEAGTGEAENVAAGDDPSADAEQPFEGLNANLAFRRLRASGETVRLRSRTNDLTAFCQELAYNAHTRHVKLSDETRVRVQHGGSRMRAPDIEMELSEEGEIASAQCGGPGWLKHYHEETGALQLAADWGKHLKKFTDEKTGLDIIELKRDALVRQPEQQMGLAGEFIQLWVSPESGDTADSDSRPMMDGYRPQRVTARTDVAMISPQMQAETDHLEVRFEEGPALSPVAGRKDERQNAQQRPPSNPSIRPAGGRRSLPQMGPNRPAPESSPSRSIGRAPARDQQAASQADEPPEPVDVTAERIHVRVVRPADGGEAQVAEIRTAGNVHVQQKQRGDRPPANLTGKRLRIVNKGGSHQVLHVYGDPASIEEELRIEAGEIEFDRHENRAQVEGAGLLELPVKQTLEGDELEKPKLLDVWWAERMTFDGKTARFVGDVRAALDHHRIRCAEMDVILAERISFQEGDRDRPEETAGNDVERIICRGSVRFDSATYENEKLVALRRGAFGRLSVNQKTGRTEARGPGWIVAWRRGQGKRAALSPSATVQANRPLKPSVSDWESFRIDFAGTMEGNIDDRLTTFHDRVEIVYGPVQRPLATIDADHLPEDAGWMRCDHLNITQHEQPAEDSGYLSLKADGNAELEGRGFYARADTITYDESKEQYVLRSRGDREASLWQQERVGQPYKKGTGQRILFVPSRNHVEVDRTTGIDGFR